MIPLTFHARPRSPEVGGGPLGARRLSREAGLALALAPALARPPSLRLPSRSRREASTSRFGLGARLGRRRRRRRGRGPRDGELDGHPLALLQLHLQAPPQSREGL